MNIKYLLADHIFFLREVAICIDTLSCSTIPLFYDPIPHKIFSAKVTEKPALTLILDVSAQRGVLSAQGGGMCARGCIPGGVCPSECWDKKIHTHTDTHTNTHTHTPVYRITDACAKSNLPTMYIVYSNYKGYFNKIPV